MHGRSTISSDLLLLEQALRDLEIRYEQYFAGVEKREPIRDREDLAGHLRRLTTRHVVQTDLRFRIQSLAARFHTYSGHWDRMVRRLEEGRLHRPAAPARKPQAAEAPAPAPAADSPLSEADRVYQQLLEAHLVCNWPGPPPDRQKVASLLDQHREKIREKFGDREVEFRVETEGGKPKIKVKAKQ